MLEDQANVSESTSMPTLEQLRELFRLRRDVRRFRVDPLPDGVMPSLIRAACSAPSVGLSEPWRFVSVESAALREQIALEFESQNEIAAGGFSDVEAEHYRRLKLAGLRDAPEHLAVFVDNESHQGRGLGRATMLETLAYSVVLAIGHLWLAARAIGVGVGWVSIVRPEAIEAALQVPSSWKLVGYLCIGFPETEEDEVPELEQAAWEHRRPWSNVWSRQ